MMNLYKWFMGMPIRKKLLWFFIVQIAVPVMLVGLISYRIASVILTEKVSRMTVATLEQAVNSIELFINGIEDISIFTLADDSVQMLMRQGAANGETASRNIDHVYKTLFNLSNSKTHISMFCIVRESDGRHFYVGPPVLIRESVVYDQPWYLDVLALDGKPLWINTHRNIFTPNVDPYIFSLARTINDNYRIQKRLGVLLINIKEDSLYQLYSGIADSQSGEAFILDTEGRIVSHRDKGLLLSSMRDQTFLDEILKTPQGAATFPIDGKMKLVTHYRIPSLGWMMVSIMPISTLVAENRLIGGMTFIVALLSIAITFILAMRLAATISSPIARLLLQMKRVSAGDFDIHVEGGYGDEISELGQGFNAMVLRIKGLIDQVYLEQKRQKEIELKALQSQINPHFLYNTLESINWMAQDLGAKDISTMVKALARFFRISISKGQDMITAGDELEHVRNYIIIQKIRYQNKLEAEVTADGDVLRCIVPKLILQPLIENAIYHGIKNKSGMGIIRVSARRGEGSVLFEVIDNGIGMKEEEIDRLNYSLNHFHGEERQGYGVRNVHERIVLRYGPEYGLTFSAIPGGGTRVKVRIPIIIGVGGIKDASCDDR